VAESGSRRREGGRSSAATRQESRGEPSHHTTLPSSSPVTNSLAPAFGRWELRPGSLRARWVHAWGWRGEQQRVRSGGEESGTRRHARRQPGSSTTGLASPDRAMRWLLHFPSPKCMTFWSSQVLPSVPFTAHTRQRAFCLSKMHVFVGLNLRAGTLAFATGFLLQLQSGFRWITLLKKQAFVPVHNPH
jgi:hypothetical protein